MGERSPDNLPPGIVRSRPRTTPGEAVATPRPAPPPDVMLEEAPTRRVRGAMPSLTGETPRITAIEPQQKREGRSNIYLEGKFALGLYDDVVLTLGLRVGQAITAERLAEIAGAETRRRALADAYRLLEVRVRAEREISDRLRRKEYDDEIITATVDHLRGLGLLDDAAFAQTWVRERGRTRGARALRFELQQKGVAGETITAALADAQDAAGEGENPEASAARTVAVRKVGERPADTSRPAQARLAAFLQRRGFGWDSIKPVLAELYAAAPDDTDPNDE